MHFTPGSHSLSIPVPPGSRGVVARIARLDLPLPGQPLIDCAIRFDTGDGANFTVIGGESFSSKSGLRNEFSGYALDLPAVAGPNGLPTPVEVASATLTLLCHADVDTDVTFEVY